MIPVASTKRQFRVVSFALLFITATATTTVTAQPAMSVPAPVIQGPIVPALNGSSVAPALPALNAGPGQRGTTTNFSLGELSALLTRFQADLDQLLPVLNSFNNGFDFVTVGVNTPQPTSSGMAANLGSNLGTSVASNLGNNVGANLSTPVTVTSGTPVSPAVANSFGFPAGLGVAPVTAETLRSLIVLQSDLQRLLPTLSALNGTTTNFVGVGLTPGFVPGAVTNVFGITSPSQ